MTFDIKDWQARFEKLPGRVDRKQYTTINYYKNGKLIATISPVPGIKDLEHAVYHDPSVEASKMDKVLLEKYAGGKEEIFDEKAFKAAREKAMKDQAAFEKEFMVAAYTDLGIPMDHPKCLKLWELSYRNGIGSGLAGVYEELDEMGELLK